MYSDRAGAGEPTDARADAPVNVDAVRRQESSEVADLVQQARGRADGFVYGDDRAIGSRPNWAAHDSKQLYAYATVDNEPGSAEEIGQTWARHGGELDRISEDLYNAITELGAAWIGQGAGAAQGALVGIANSGAQASEAARTMRDRLAQQAAAAAKLKSMPQPKEFDPAAETAAMLAGGPAAMVRDMKEQFDAAQETKAQQVAFLEAYTAELAEIDSKTPSFGPESLGLKPLAAGADTEASRLGAVGTYGMPGGDMGAVPAGFGTAGIGTAGAGTHGADPVAAPGAEGARAAHAPASGMGSAPGVGSGQAHAATAGGGGGPSVGQSLGAAAAGGALGYAGVRALRSGKRSGAKKEPLEHTGETGAASATGDLGETVASANQQTGGAAPTSVPNQGAMTPGTIGAGQPAPAAGAAGAPMGMGGMGAGGAGQDDEREHTHASFLIEPDPDATFGATESAAPPVLGAWGPEDEER